MLHDDSYRRYTVTYLQININTLTITLINTVLITFIVTLFWVY